MQVCAYMSAVVLRCVSRKGGGSKEKEKGDNNSDAVFSGIVVESFNSCSSGIEQIKEQQVVVMVKQVMRVKIFVVGWSLLLILMERVRLEKYRDGSDRSTMAHVFQYVK